jgi:hypothetical protein
MKGVRELAGAGVAGCQADGISLGTPASSLNQTYPVDRKQLRLCLRRGTIAACKLRA